MLQTLFPVFPEDVRFLNSNIAVKNIGNDILYFNGAMLIYKHEKDNYQSFRLVSSQLYVYGNANQKDIVNFFNVSPESVKRWVKIYREQGRVGFFKTQKGKKKGHILTKEILIKIQTRLNTGATPGAIGKDLAIKIDTIRKAIGDGRLTRPDIVIEPDKSENKTSKTQSERNKEDSEAVKGMACTNTQERMDAIVKKK